jgi:hypothetical protein
MDPTLPAEQEDAFWSGVEYAQRFFMGESNVHSALERLVRLLDEHGIPYAVIGAMALNQWGYKPKPVVFPDPARAAVRGRGIALIELVRALSLPRELGASLDLTVRVKFDELWEAAQAADRD